ncbi:hypothetical protein DTL42_23675 [Bremerella cremea]|uniref:Uncharacterized protein n=1 Tax=Bremerella cremea TaxID=1031537 RepID=A0A368KLC1_9BACT|nr:hypothetical protein DTL42_23675 [Bremerella cremea]
MGTNISSIQKDEKLFSQNTFVSFDKGSLAGAKLIQKYYTHSCPFANHSKELHFAVKNVLLRQIVHVSSMTIVKL